MLGSTFPSHIRVLAPVLLIVLGLSLPAIVRAGEPLILAVHPYLRLDELVKRYSPLADRLSRDLGQRVVLRIGRNYQEHIGHIGHDKVHIAFMGPASYVKMVDIYGNKPLLARLEISGKPLFHGMIIARKESPVETLGDLKGKRFAFGDTASTMNHLVPRLMLWKADVAAEDLADYQFLGSHTNVALGVLAGDFDAGAVKEEVFHQFENRGLKAIATTPAISEHVFVARSNLPPETVRAAREALYRLRDTAEGRAIMRGIKETMTGMVPTRDADYDSLRVILKTLKGLGTRW